METITNTEHGTTPVGQGNTTGRWQNIRFGLTCVAGGVGIVAAGCLVGGGIELFCARYGAFPLRLFALVLFVTLPFALHLSINRRKRLTGRWVGFYLYYSAGLAGGIWGATVQQHIGPIDSTAFLTQGVLQLCSWMYLFGTVVVALWAQSGDVPEPSAVPEPVTTYAVRALRQRPYRLHR